jgi:DNA replication protein DnaC
MFARLASLSFVARKESIIITGPSGVGKCYLAQTIVNQTCLMSHRTLYANTSRLLSRLKLSKLEGTYLWELQMTDLLILDYFVLQAFDANAREILMDLIDGWFNETSTIVSSQIPVSAW